MLQRKKSVAAGFKAAWAVCFWFALASVLGGCGQKGPLFLPAPAVAPASSPASAP